MSAETAESGGNEAINALPSESARSASTAETDTIALRATEKANYESKINAESKLQISLCISPYIYSAVIKEGLIRYSLTSSFCCSELQRGISRVQQHVALGETCICQRRI